MITYSTNWMGPVTRSWYTDRGLDPMEGGWNAGRIDIRGVEDEPYGLEYGLSIMSTRSWHELSIWLNSLQTKELWTYDQIIQEFENNNNKIEWWKDE